MKTSNTCRYPVRLITCLHALAATCVDAIEPQELQSIISTLRKVQYKGILSFSSKIGALASGMASPFKEYIRAFSLLKYSFQTLTINIPYRIF